MDDGPDHPSELPRGLSPGQNKVRVRAKQKWFGHIEVIAHLRRHHPHCSSSVHDAITERVCRRGWTKGTTLGAAVGMTLENFVRHNFTDYDALLRKQRVHRDEARLVVRNEVDGLLESWRSKGKP
jgi:hypothetical protein